MSSDNDELGLLSRGTNPLEDMGYDPEEVRANPDMRRQVMAQLGSPLGLQPHSGASIGRMAPPTTAEPEQPAAQPQAPAMQSVPDVAPVENPTRAQIPTEALTKGLAEAGMEDTLARKMAADSDGPNTQALEQRRDQLSSPTQLYGGDGKMLDQYKPSAWQRVLRGVEAFQHGGVFGPLDPSAVGASPYGAPNSSYGRAEAARQGQLATTNQDLSDTVARFKRTTDARKDATNALNKGTTDYTNVAKTGGELETADTNQAREDREATENSPAGKAAAQTALNEATFTQRTKDADRIFGGPGKGGQQRTFYMLNGKVPDPRQATESDIAYSGALKAFVKEHNRAPATLEEYNQVRAASGGRLKDEYENSPEVQSIVAKATGDKQIFADQWERQPDGSYLKKGATKVRINQKSGDRMEGNEFNSKVDQYRLDANRALARYNARMDEQGNVVAMNGANAGAQAGTPGSQVSPAPGGLPPVPQGYVRVAKNGVVQDVPSGKLAEAQRRGWSKQ